MKRRLECADCGKLLALYDDSDPDEVRGALTASNGHACKAQRAANRAAQKATQTPRKAPTRDDG